MAVCSSSSPIPSSLKAGKSRANGCISRPGRKISTWTELFGLGFGGNTSNKGPQSLKLQLHAEFNCVHLLTSLGQKRAGALAATIQRDIDYGEFDASLDKYKPAAALSTVTPIAPTPETPPQLGLSELWEKYTEFKQPQLSQSTYAVDYRRYRNHIKKLPTNDLRDAN